MTPGKRRSLALLCSVAPFALVLALSGSIAHADGGDGGQGNAMDAPGTGGTLGNPGGAGTGTSGGGGGGAGGGAGGAGGLAGGGAGGDGGAHGFTGVTLPPSNATGDDGENGGDSTGGWGTGGGGGGAGGYGAIVTDGGTATIGGGQEISGGTGGNGGQGDGGGSGGDGGDGGVGLSFSGDTLTNAGMVTGGAGGRGNAGFVGGVGGDGGVGLSLSDGTVINVGTISGGSGGETILPLYRGVGGDGITGSNLTVVNAGTISGGLAPDGAQANAVTFTGGSNRFEMWNTSIVNGLVDATAGTDAVFSLGGAASATFDVSAIGLGYLGFENFEKTGASIWTLAATTTEITPWTLKEGTLSVSSDDSLGDISGGLTFDGGILRVTGTAFSSTARSIMWGDGGGGFDIADAANTFVLGQNLVGDGNFSKLGAGALTLTGDNQVALFDVRNGTMLVDGGTLEQSVAAGLSAVGKQAGEDAVLRVANGGTVNTAHTVHVGDAAGSRGQVVVTGNASSLNVRDITIGFAGEGNVSVVEGGLLSSADFMNVGGGNWGQLGDGLLTVEGVGSRAEIGGLIIVAGYGDGATGTITVADGGVLEVSQNVRLGLANPSGSAALNIGAASTVAADAVAAGTFLAPEVEFNAGTASLNFNHTDSAYTFGADLRSVAGSSFINHYAGGTTLTGDGSGFSGDTIVHGGTLAVDGTLGGTMAVNAGATLAGSGTVGTTTIADGGILGPGNSIGSLTVAGNLNLSAGSILNYELGSPGASGSSPGLSDSIAVTGDLVLNGTLNLSQSGDPADGEAGIGYYRLMTYGGDLSGDGLTIGTTPPLADPATYQIQSGGGNVDLFVASLGDDRLQHWQGGNGIWNASNEKWLNQGSDVLVVWAGNHAVFKNEPGGFDGGTIEVEGAQSFKGLQFVDSGYRLEGTGSLVVDGSESPDGDAEIRVLTGETATIATTITGTGGIKKTQGGTLVLEGTNTYQGGTQLLGGVLSVSSNANLGDVAGNLTFNGGTLQNTAAFATARDVTLDAGGGTFQTDAALTVEGVVSGEGSLTKTGTGLLTLVNANSYSGGTTISSGGIDAAATGALGTGPVNIATGGELSLINDANGESLDISLATDASLRFFGTASAGEALVTNRGRVNFYDDSAAGSARFANDDGVISFNNRSSAGSSTIEGGTVGFYGHATADQATIVLGVQAEAYDMATGRLSIGSLSGEGEFTLGSTALTLGGLGNDDTFRGTLIDSRPGDTRPGMGSGASLTKSGTGTLTLTGANTYTGGTTVNAGTLQIGDGGTTGSILGPVDIASAGRFSFNRSDSFAFDGALSGGGHFVKQGGGMLLYDGDGSGFTGNTIVADGGLIVGSDAAHAGAALGGSFDVQDGGILGGHGAIGSGVGSLVTIASGGTIAPGNSIGTLTVDGDITFAAGSIYEAEINPALDNDLIDASGKATIEGGTVYALKAGGVYTPGSRWTILGADGGVDGTFDALDQNMPFVDLELAYDATHVYIDATRNNVAFCDVARTFNQCSTGEGIESTGAGNVVYDAVAALADEDSARAALDALSGEMHASLKSALVEDSHFVRDAVSERIRSAFGGATSPMPVLAYGPDGIRPTAPDSEGPAAWGYAFGAWGKTDGDGNAATLDSSTGGFLTGVDGAVLSNVRLGFFAGYSHSSFSVDERASSGSSENYHLGLYGGGQWDALRLSGGLSYTWHDIETSRSIVMPGFADTVSADYRAGTFQAFGEAGYRIDMGRASFEPFAGLAHVRLSGRSFAEDGGAAALAGQGSGMDTTFATLGIRASTALDLGGMKARAHGMIGWRHSFGDVTPFSTHTFAGSDAFTVAGVPIARDAALLEAGLDIDIAPGAMLGIAYKGQIAGGAQEHGFNAKFNVKF